MKRQVSAQLKPQILEEARQPNTAIAEVCRRHQISAAQFYTWHKAVQQAALQALVPKPRGRDSSQQREERLQVKIQRLRATISEITAENLELKKGWRMAEKNPFYLRGEATRVADGRSHSPEELLDDAPHSAASGAIRLGILWRRRACGRTWPSSDRGRSPKGSLAHGGGEGHL